MSEPPCEGRRVDRCCSLLIRLWWLGFEVTRRATVGERRQLGEVASFASACGRPGMTGRSTDARSASLTRMMRWLIDTAGRTPDEISRRTDRLEIAKRSATCSNVSNLLTGTAPLQLSSRCDMLRHERTLQKRGDELFPQVRASRDVKPQARALRPTDRCDRRHEAVFSDSSTTSTAASFDSASASSRGRPDASPW